MTNDNELIKSLRDRLIEIYDISEAELDSYESAISAHAITSMQTEQPASQELLTYIDRLEKALATCETVRGNGMHGNNGYQTFNQYAIAAALESKPKLPAPTVTCWQPIATAPKDGTEILLFNDKKKYIANGNFGQKGHEYANPNVWVWPYIHLEPTHWMPLNKLTEAEDGLENLISSKRIAVIPEYEGGFNAYLYGDEEQAKHEAYGATPSEAVKNVISMEKK